MLSALCKVTYGAVGPYLPSWSWTKTPGWKCLSLAALCYSMSMYVFVSAPWVCLKNLPSGDVFNHLHRSKQLLTWMWDGEKHIKKKGWQIILTGLLYSETTESTVRVVCLAYSSGSINHWAKGSSKRTSWLFLWIYGLNTDPIWTSLPNVWIWLEHVK